MASEDGATPWLNYSQFLRLSSGKAWEQTERKEDKGQRTIYITTHKQRRALGDRKLRTEKDAETEEGLRAMTEA